MVFTTSYKCAVASVLYCMTEIVYEQLRNDRVHSGYGKLRRRFGYGENVDYNDSATDGAKWTNCKGKCVDRSTLYYLKAANHDWIIAGNG